MKSGHILSLHTGVFTLFTLASLSSPLVAINYPQFFSLRNILIIGVIAVLTIATWPIFGGICPFTALENRLRELESPPGSAYKGPCIDRYAKEWFGIEMPERSSTMILVGLLLLPIFSGIFLR